MRPTITMFAALYGKLTFHPWYDPLVATEDAYSLFYARSAAMGWLAEAREHTSGGLWHMNDAGLDREFRSSPARIAWFQVALAEPVPVPADRPLPLQPFLSCAGDVVARMGKMRLQAVQVLLPVHSLDAPAGASSRLDAVGTLLQATGWFAGCGSHFRTEVRITLEGGQDSTLPSAAPGMLQWMQGVKQDVFTCDSLSLLDEDAVLLEPGIPNHLWLGPPRHRATFRGTLAEWSLDALGWLAAFFAEASWRHGVSTPLILTITRSEERAASTG